MVIEEHCGDDVGWLLTGAAKNDGKKWRQADTNVVAIRFDQLTKPSNMHTGDAISCKRCRAVMSHLSAIKDPEADEKVVIYRNCVMMFLVI